MAAPRSASGIGTPEKHTACIDCGIRLVSRWHYNRNMSPAEKAHRGTGFGIHNGRGLCEKCARRARRGGQVNNPPGAEVACPRCERTTVSYALWRSVDAEQRAAIRAAGKIARMKRDGTCTSCYSAQRDGRDGAEAVEPAKPVAYEGRWVRRGLILVPTDPTRGAA